MNTVDYIAEQKIRSYDVAWEQAPQLGKKAKKAKKAKTTSVDDSSDKLDNDIDRIKSYPVDT